MLISFGFSSHIQCHNIHFISEERGIRSAPLCVTLKIHSAKANEDGRKHRQM